MFAARCFMRCYARVAPFIKMMMMTPRAATLLCRSPMMPPLCCLFFDVYHAAAICRRYCRLRRRYTQMIRYALMPPPRHAAHYDAMPFTTASLRADAAMR